MSGNSDDTPIRLSSSTYALRGAWLGWSNSWAETGGLADSRTTASCFNRELDERSEKDDVTGLQKRPVPDDA